MITVIRLIHTQTKGSMNQKWGACPNKRTHYHISIILTIQHLFEKWLDTSFFCSTQTGPVAERIFFLTEIYSHEMKPTQWCLEKWIFFLEEDQKYICLTFALRSKPMVSISTTDYDSMLHHVKDLKTIRNWEHLFRSKPARQFGTAGYIERYAKKPEKTSTKSKRIQQKNGTEAWSILTFSTQSLTQTIR